MKSSLKQRVKQATPELDQLALGRLAGKGVALSALVDDLSKDLGYTPDEVTESLMRLQSRKVIVITEKTRHVFLGSYAASSNSLWFWTAVGATLLSVAFLFATSGLALYVRYVFGALLVLFLPGYSLIEVLYPKKELDELARFGLSIGLSLALAPLVGLVLNYTPFGIRLLPVVFSLAGLTLTFLVLALRKKYTYYKVAKNPA